MAEKFKVLLCLTGSVASIKAQELVESLQTAQLEVRVATTERAKHFLDIASFPELLDDETEWKTWSKRGDPVLHIEQRKWADLLLIAPLDANTMGKVCSGICDNLVTCVIRAWDTKKPLLFAPAMNTYMWEHPCTAEQIRQLTKWGYKYIPVIEKTLMCGDKDISMPKGKKRAAEANMEASGTSSKTTKKSKGNVSEDGCHVFFFGIDCTFSQFHPAKFTDSDGREYNCMEQYMHYHKAVTFKDDEMAKKIMETDDPKQHKKYGRQVQNFDADVWKAKSLEVVFDGSILKYKQNPEMKEVLFATSSKTLVEASPRDRLWGVGMGQNNPKIHNPANWRGKNLLGKTLTQVRDKLMKDEQAV